MRRAEGRARGMVRRGHEGVDAPADVQDPVRAAQSDDADDVGQGRAAGRRTVRVRRSQVARHVRRGDDVWEESGRGVHRGPRVRECGERESESAPGSAPRNGKRASASAHAEKMDSRRTSRWETRQPYSESRPTGPNWRLFARNLQRKRRYGGVKSCGSRMLRFVWRPVT